MSALIEIDKSDYRYCSIDSPSLIRDTLGDPLDLPPAIEDSLGEGNYEENLLRMFSLMTGYEYERVTRDNTYNYDSDLSQFFIYSVYAPVGNPDWVWQSDCFVTIEMGTDGDPRYVNYCSPEVYSLGHNMIGDIGFLDWRLSWLAQPLSDKDTLENLDEFNERLSQGYSNDPTFELSELVVFEPLWNERRQGYIAKFKEHPYPVLLTPYSYIQ